jgi:hypothetical protein
MPPPEKIIRSHQARNKMTGRERGTNYPRGR